KEAALRPGPGLVAAPCGAPDELPGAAFALRTVQASPEHVGLLDLHVLVVRQARAGRHAHQRGDEPGLLVDEQRLLLDTRVGRFFPRQVFHIDKSGSEICTPVHDLRCSPTLTIFIVLVPPALPMGSPMVSTMMSPSFTTLLATSVFSASCSS